MTRSRSTLPTRRLRAPLLRAGASGIVPKHRAAFTEFGRTNRNRASEPLITKRCKAGTGLRSVLLFSVSRTRGRRTQAGRYIRPTSPQIYPVETVDASPLPYLH